MQSKAPLINTNGSHQFEVSANEAHLRQISQLRSLPAQLVKDAVVKGLLLPTATAQLGQIGIVQAGPVLGERLGAVPLDLPDRQHGKHATTFAALTIDTI